MPRLFKTKSDKPKMVSLREFQEKRNKVLILRTTGGLGDIFMHRMMFEDIKKLHPDFDVTFACPPKYFDAVKDHPYIDHIVDCRTVDTKDYLIHYNTTSACTRHEIGVAPFSDKNRSDIWANHCGVELNRHKMHIRMTPKEIKWGETLLKKVKGEHPGPFIFLCPISAMVVKNLLNHQLVDTVKGIQKMGGFVCGLHYTNIDLLSKIGVPTIFGLKVREWMSAIAACDYMVTVDTASFHFAGGIKKPTTGIFTFADGKIYGKYYDFELVQKHRDNGDWDCGPCYNWSSCPHTKKQPKPCLTKLTADEILDGVERMFVKHPHEKLHIPKRVSLNILE